MWGWSWISREVGTVLKKDLLACAVDWEKQVFHGQKSLGGDQVRPPSVELVS